MLKNKQVQENFIIALSIALLFLSTYLFMSKELAEDNTMSNLIVEYVNIKNMSTAKIAYKDGSTIKENNKQSAPTNRIDIVPTVENASEQTAVQQMSVTSPIKWQLPTKTGIITSYPNYNHVAIDITSRNGIYEAIYPVSNGIVTGIYNDSAGAKIVTIHHNVDGIDYTSQYVHLSSYASGLYVGKYVTMDEAIGQMGATGMATGVHLHITVVDNCILFNPNDANCKDLNSFFRYIKIRYNQGFKGLDNLINVPNSW